MSSDLPFDIIALIIDIVGENKDKNLLKELALVSHSFLQICSKHLFATVALHDADPKAGAKYHTTSSKKGFVKLLKSRPDVVKYIRKLVYFGSPTNPSFNNDDHLLLPILPNLLRTIPSLNCLTIIGDYRSNLDWNTLDSSLTSALLHLTHLPTVNHINLSYIQDFPLSSFIPSVNLHRLHVFYLKCFDRPEEDAFPEIDIQSEMMPKIREFRTSGSQLLTTKLLHAKGQDGRPAFNFMDLRRLSTSFYHPEDKQNTRYLLQNAKLLEKLDLSLEGGRSIAGLHDILSPSARTLKFLDLNVFLYDSDHPGQELAEELEAMAGHNVLQALSFKVYVDVRNGHATEEFIGSFFQRVEKVLVEPGWSALRQVSIEVIITCWPSESREDSEKLSEELQSLPDKYLSCLPKLESVAFKYLVHVLV
jgi:hypothetical protein